MKLKPLYQKVIVRRHSEPDRSPGGIVIPDSARDGKDSRSWTGTVVAVGAGRVLPDGTLLPLQVKVGDTVICPQYIYRDNQGIEHNADITITVPEGEAARESLFDKTGEKLYVVLEPDIHAVVEK